MSINLRLLGIVFESFRLERLQLLSPFGSLILLVLGVVELHESFRGYGEAGDADLLGNLGCLLPMNNGRNSWT